MECFFLLLSCSFSSLLGHARALRTSYFAWLTVKRIEIYLPSDGSCCWEVRFSTLMRHFCYSELGVWCIWCGRKILSWSHIRRMLDGKAKWCWDNLRKGFEHRLWCLFDCENNAQMSPFWWPCMILWFCSCIGVLIDNSFDDLVSYTYHVSVLKFAMRWLSITAWINLDMSDDPKLLSGSIQFDLDW